MAPWDEGANARRRGESAASNPYHPTSEEFVAWADGWADLNEHFRDRDEALASIGWFGR